MIFVIFEYLCLIKANQWGFEIFTIFQLGLLAEFINWIVFLLYIKFYQKEKIVLKMWLSLIIMSIIMSIGIGLAYF